MAFRRCPDCGAEWWNEETCLDCGGTLVDLPDETTGDAPPRSVAGPPDSSILVVAEPEPPRLARFLGFLFDYLLTSMVLVVLGLIVSDTRVRFDDGRRVTRHVLPSWSLAFYGVFIVVYATVSVAKWQRTPGMVASGIGVERVGPDGSGSQLSWSTSAIRAIVATGWFAIPPSIPLDTMDAPYADVLRWIFLIWPIVVFAPILIDPQRRGLHDLLLQTRVVRRPPPQWARNLPGLASSRRARGGPD